ncbi:MAG: ISKra4 family transposase, partial [Gammaproteobacteria bacterium]|nr:ISKra4 family transposase [Gammaproteobacteria bacterium]
MNLAYLDSNDFSFFSVAQEEFNLLIQQLKSNDKAASEHGDIESFINKKGHEVMRHLLQGWLDLKADKEEKRDSVISASGEYLNHVRIATSRSLENLFGKVKITRIGYNQINKPSLFPTDAELNLATDRYSDGLYHRVSNEAIRGSFDNVVETVSETTGGHIPKKQSLNVVKDVAQDFEAFYQQKRFIEPEDTSDLLVLTFDDKGIVMRPDSLRECTKKNAQKTNKLASRLSQGEKKDRKRMAQVAAVYTVQPHCRTAESIMKHSDDNVIPFRTPIRNKLVWASIEREAKVVIEEAFREALQRDPKQTRQWVILIDGLPHQIKLINKVMEELNINATIAMDFIHVLEYLWKAAWCFFDKGDEAVEEWIAEKSINILNGHCSQVSKGLRSSTTKRKITDRINIDKCADYLLKNKERLQYGVALESGLPIASGVIEGACRHLINDRLDITGACWSLQGAEAILKLRSLKSSGDFKNYWTFYKKMSKTRNY